MSAHSLDTNAVLRFLLGDVPAQTAAVERLLNDRKKSFHVADVVLVEVEYVLRQVYGLSRQAVAENVSAVVSHPNIVANRTLADKVLPEYLAHPKLSFTDCCLVSYAELSQATPLYTFDRVLARQADGAALLAGPSSHTLS